MLKELAVYLTDVGKVAYGNRVVSFPAEPDHVYGLIGSDGLIPRHEAEPLPRDHTVRSLESLVDLAELFARDDQRVAIWYGRNGVVALLDDATRRDRATFHLHRHPAFDRLEALEALPDDITPYTPRE